jgi:hypothetical protein
MINFDVLRLIYTYCRCNFTKFNILNSSLKFCRSALRYDLVDKSIILKFNRIELINAFIKIQFYKYDFSGKINFLNDLISIENDIIFKLNFNIIHINNANVMKLESEDFIDKLLLFAFKNKNYDLSLIDIAYINLILKKNIFKYIQHNDSKWWIENNIFSNSIHNIIKINQCDDIYMSVIYPLHKFNVIDEWYRLIKYSFNVVTNLNNLLKWSVDNNRTDIFKLLISSNIHNTINSNLIQDEFNKIDISFDDNYPIRKASYEGYIDIVKLLINKKNIRKINVHAKNHYALKYACNNNHYRIVKLLIQAAYSKEKIDDSIIPLNTVHVVVIKDHYKVLKIFIDIEYPLSNFDLPKLIKLADKYDSIFCSRLLKKYHQKIDKLNQTHQRDESEMK